MIGVSSVDQIEFSAEIRNTHRLNNNEIVKENIHKVYANPVSVYNWLPKLFDPLNCHTQLIIATFLLLWFCALLR